MGYRKIQKVKTLRDINTFFYLFTNNTTAQHCHNLSTDLHFSKKRRAKVHGRNIWSPRKLYTGRSRFHALFAASCHSLMHRQHALGCRKLSHGRSVNTLSCLPASQRSILTTSLAISVSPMGSCRLLTAIRPSPTMHTVFQFLSWHRLCYLDQW